MRLKKLRKTKVLHHSSPYEAKQSTTNAPTPQDKEEQLPPLNDPTKYGDWIKNGRCIDF